MDSARDSHVRSLIDQAGKLFDNAVEQLKTPRKDSSYTGDHETASENGSTTGVPVNNLRYHSSTPGSLHKREAEEFPSSHDVYSMSSVSTTRNNVELAGTRRNLVFSDTTSEDSTEGLPRRRIQGKRRRGIISYIFVALLLVMYVIIATGTSCMVVAHVGMVPDVQIIKRIPLPVQGPLKEILDTSGRVISEHTSQYINPYARMLHHEVCVERVNPVLHFVREKVVKAYSDLKQLVEEQYWKHISHEEENSSENNVAVYKDVTQKPPSIFSSRLASMIRFQAPWWLQPRTRAASDPLAIFVTKTLSPFLPAEGRLSSFIIHAVVEPIAVVVSSLGGMVIAAYLMLYFLKRLHG